MNNLIGRIITGKITDENDKYYFVQSEGVTFELDKSEIKKPFKIGANFKGFAYENENHKLQITRNIPKIRMDHYGFAPVVKEKFGLGVFVDIGLPNKDIVVSIDELPTIHSLWPQDGDRLLIDLIVDSKGRLWGHLADEDIFQAIARPVKSNLMNKNISATAYRLKLAGTHLLSDDYHLAFLHPDERQIEPRLGQRVSGRVIGTLKDGTINISTRPRAYEEIDDDAKMILESLKRSANGILEFSDKSDPKEIKDYFGISKASFKRAIGHLLKNNLIIQVDGHIELKKLG